MVLFFMLRTLRDEEPHKNRFRFIFKSILKALITNHCVVISAFYFNLFSLISGVGARRNIRLASVCLIEGCQAVVLILFAIVLVSEIGDIVRHTAFKH